MFHGDLKDKREEKECSGIYELNCENCEKVYIGQTRKSINIRAKEHQRNVKNKEVLKSSVASHAVEESHTINFKPRLIKKVRKIRELDIWENIEMYKRKDKLMNEELEGTHNILFKHLRSDNIRKENIQQQTAASAAVQSSGLH